MITLQLYHKGDWVNLDLQDDPGFVLNRQFSDLENPTSYFAEYSKTVSIPHTKTNNEVMNKIFRIDSLIFDAKTKVKFRILTNNAIIFSGVAKINSSTFDSYELQLSGEMSDTLRFLKNLTFSESDYQIPNPLSPALKIDRHLIKQSWDNVSPQINLSGCSDVDIIGFAPTIHGLNENFNSKQFSDGTKVTDISKYINTTLNTTQGDNIVGDGLNELQFMDFRSYYQKPYIYINKLWQIFKKTAENDVRCNYKLYLDSSWFNAGNPLYTDIIYMLPDMIGDNISSDISSKDHQDFTGETLYPANGNPIGIDSAHNILYPDTFASTPDQEVNITSNLNLSIEAANTGAIIFDKARLDPDNGLIINIDAIDPRTNFQLQTYSIIIVNKDKCDIDTTSYDQVIQVDKVDITRDAVTRKYKALWNVEIPINLNYRLGRPFKLRYRTHFYNSSMPFQGYEFATLGIWCNFYQTGRNAVSMDFKSTKSINSRNLRSNSVVDMARLWPAEKSVFDVLLDYCKLFNLIITVDNNENTINIMTKRRYFNEMKVIDWTDKADMTGILIQPSTFQTKYVQFGYNKDNSDSNLSGYNTKYKAQFGSKILDTGYEFNNETTNLFESIQPSIDCSLNMTSFMNIIVDWSDENTPLPVYASKNIYPSNLNDDKSADLWGNFYFRSGSQPLDPNLYGSFAGRGLVYISDDDDFQLMHNSYCYTVAENFITQSAIIPLISTLSKDKVMSLMFNKPKEIFCDKSFISSSTKYVYDEFWKRWINERYSIENKIVTLPIYLTPIDYINFDFNKFVSIGNNLFCVNKIIDFDPTSIDKLTQVELIQISNPESYKVGDDIPYIDTNRRVVNYTNKQENVLVSSSSPWKIASKPVWITTTQTDNMITIACPAWDNPSIRKGRVHLVNNEGASCIIEINQYQSDTRLWINPNTFIFQNDGGEYSATISSSSPVTIQSQPDWITTNIQNKVLNISAPSNRDTLSRQGHIILVNKNNLTVDVKVYQQGNLNRNAITKIYLRPNTPINIKLNSRSKIQSIRPIDKQYILQDGKQTTPLTIPVGKKGDEGVDYNTYITHTPATIMIEGVSSQIAGSNILNIPAVIVNKIIEIGGLSLIIEFVDNSYQTVILSIFDA